MVCLLILQCLVLYQSIAQEFSKRLLAGTLPTSAEQSGLAAELDLLRREREQLKQSLERTQSELQRANSKCFFENKDINNQKMHFY